MKGKDVTREGSDAASDGVSSAVPGFDDTIAAVWPVAGDRRRGRRGSHPVFQILKWGFVAVAVLCVLAIVVLGAVAWRWPSVAGSAYLALLNINIILGALAAIYVARRLVVLFLDRRGRLRGGRLHIRVLGIFAILAVLPAVGVGGVAIYLLNQGIEGWFATKVSAALEGGKLVAEGYLEESQRGLVGEIQSLAREPVWQLPVVLEKSSMAAWLRQGVFEKRLDDLAVVDGDGMVLASGSGFAGGSVSAFVLGMIQGPLAGPQVSLVGDGSRMVAVVPLRNNLWLVGQRGLHSDMLQRIKETAVAYRGYEDLRAHQDRIQMLASWFLILLLGGTVTLAVWTAIRLANKIVRPVTELVHGTNRVSAGDFSVRLMPRDDDELGVLTQAFNRMTLQLASGRDLVERKNRELDERRRFIEAVLTGVTAGVVAVDDSGVVRIANQSAQAMLGIAVGDKLSREVPELSEMVREVNRAVMEGQNFGTKGLFQREVKVTLSEGDTRTLLVRLVPQHANTYGEVRGGVVMTFDDITPLIGAQRLAAWQDVARRLAHEIKNPLTPIQLSAERLKRKYLAQMPEADKALFAQLTDTIVSQAEEMRRMTNEFSDFARMPQARMSHENMVEILDGVVALQRGRGGVKFETEYEIAAPLVNVDKGQVTRVITNLIENACNAIAERDGAPGKGGGDEVGSTNLPQGEVRIVVKKQQPDILSIDIHDNGRGLPVDVAVEQLFDPYVTTRKGGTGLGLAIVKRVMDEHGGQVRLLRRKGGGTTVALTLPLLGELPVDTTVVPPAKKTTKETLTDEHKPPSQKRDSRNSGGGRRGRNPHRPGGDS